MKFVDFNFVSDEQAKKIMESYGYDVPEVEEVTPEEASVIEESQVVLPDYVALKMICTSKFKNYQIL